MLAVTVAIAVTYLLLAILVVWMEILRYRRMPPRSPGMPDYPNPPPPPPKEGGMGRE